MSGILLLRLFTSLTNFRSLFINSRFSTPSFEMRFDNNGYIHKSKGWYIHKY